MDMNHGVEAGILLTALRFLFCVGGWGIRGFSVGYSLVVSWLSVCFACYPCVTPVGFTHGCVLVTALRFGLPMRTEGPARS